MRRVLSIAARSLAACSLLVALAARPAGAHAEVRESEPPAGGVAPAGTEEVSMTFISMDPSEPVEVSVLDPDGDEVTEGDVRVEETTRFGTTVVAPVAPLEQGPHLVSWRALSNDGDGITASTFEFRVEADSDSSALGTWLLWAVALLVPAAIFLLPRRRRERSTD